MINKKAQFKNWIETTLQQKASDAVSARKATMQPVPQIKPSE